MTVWGNQLVVFGGFHSSTNRSNDTFLFDTVSLSWSRPIDAQGGKTSKHIHTYHSKGERSSTVATSSFGIFLYIIFLSLFIYLFSTIVSSLVIFLCNLISPFYLLKTMSFFVANVYKYIFETFFFKHTSIYTRNLKHHI